MDDDNGIEELLDDEAPRRRWSWVNGENQQRFSLGSIASLATLLLAFSGLTAYVAILKADIADNKRAIDDLYHQFERYESSDQVWKDEEHRYDAEVRTTMKEQDQGTRESLRRINDRVNAIAIAKGIQVPP